MDVTPRGLIFNWLPGFPSLLKTIFLAPIGHSPNAEYQDSLTEVIVQSARPILKTPASLLKSQNFFLLDFGVWGKWVCRYSIPAPTNHHFVGSTPDPYEGDLGGNHVLLIEQAVAYCIDSLATSPDERSCPIPQFSQPGVEIEWTCHRADAHFWSRMPSNLSDRQIYDRITTSLPEGPDSPVILFAHGGAFCLMDPCNHRSTVTRMAKLTNSRVMNVRYRLSPQSIFPGALMDMFLAYLALLCPPPGSFHTSVPGNRIILAGDSSGGNLVSALQVLLSTLVKHGKTSILNPWSIGDGDSIITIPNPPTAALSLVSPWLDITRSLPSCSLNSRYDFIAPPEPLNPSLMTTSPLFPPDEIWPAKPVRTETYCDAVMCAHPLVSPLTVPKEVLACFPATYACTGWEGMTDETEVFIRRLAEALSCEGGMAGEPRSSIEAQTGESDLPGKEVIFDGYLGMPHVFSSLQYNAAGADANQNRADHIKKAIAMANVTEFQSADSRAAGAILRATWTNVKSKHKSTIRAEDLGITSEFSGYVREEPLTDDVVSTKVATGRKFRVELEKRLREDERRNDESKELGKL